MSREFIIESHEVIITDPCYDLDSSKVVDVLPGVYIADVKYVNGVISELSITHTNHNVDSELELLSEDIGVDSGQCGFFDTKYYREDDYYINIERINPDHIICADMPFYSACCDRTIGKVRWGTIPFGAVSSSGYGDGCYFAYGAKNNDNLFTYLKLVFVIEHEEEG